MKLTKTFVLWYVLSPERRWVSASIAFMLAMFTHLLTHVNERIQNALYEAKHPKLIKESDDSSGKELNVAQSFQQMILSVSSTVVFNDIE